MKISFIQLLTESRDERPSFNREFDKAWAIHKDAIMARVANDKDPIRSSFPTIGLNINAQDRATVNHGIRSALWNTIKSTSGEHSSNPEHESLIKPPRWQLGTKGAKAGSSSKYVGLLMKWIANKHTQRLEDTYTTQRATLEKYDFLKRNKLLSDRHTNNPWSPHYDYWLPQAEKDRHGNWKYDTHESMDFNNFKDPDKLKGVVDHPVYNDHWKAPTREQQFSALKEGKDYHKIYEDDHVTIHHVLNEEANRAFGTEPGTSKVCNWCTAQHYSGDNEMFKSYSKVSPLLVLTPKQKNHNDEMYQYHLGSVQFNDEKDNPAHFDSDVGSPLHRKYEHVMENYSTNYVFKNPDKHTFISRDRQGNTRLMADYRILQRHYQASRPYSMMKKENLRTNYGVRYPEELDRDKSPELYDYYHGEGHNLTSEQRDNADAIFGFNQTSRPGDSHDRHRLLQRSDLSHKTKKYIAQYGSFSDLSELVHMPHELDEDTIRSLHHSLSDKHTRDNLVGVPASSKKLLLDKVKEKHPDITSRVLSEHPY